jgi:hypothetical protein
MPAFSLAPGWQAKLLVYRMLPLAFARGPTSTAAASMCPSNRPRRRIVEALSCSAWTSAPWAITRRLFGASSIEPT